jgi:hypothetical protein
MAASAMEDAADLLRRRDLASYEETPLYFAWERLYAARNKSLSVDFLRETPAESADRKQARLAPRQGLPPPRTSRKAEAWTTFDAPLRKSLQASSFLRPTEVLNPAAVDAIARRYRRQAAKHRAARGGSLDDPLVLDAGQTPSSRNRSKKSKKLRMNQQVQLKMQTLGLSEMSDQDDEDNEDAHAGGRSGHNEGVEINEDTNGDSFTRVEGVAKVAPISGEFPPALGRAANAIKEKSATPGVASGASPPVAVNNARTPDPANDATFQENAELKLTSEIHKDGPAPAEETAATSALLSKLFQYVHADQDPATSYLKVENTSSNLESSQPPKTVVRHATGAEPIKPSDAGRRTSRRHNGNAQVDDTIDEGDEWEEDDAELSPTADPVEDRDRRRSSAIRDSSTRGSRSSRMSRTDKSPELRASQATVSRRPTGVIPTESADAGRRISRRHNGNAQVDDTIDEGDEWEEDDAELSPTADPVEDRDRRRSSAIRDKSILIEPSGCRRNWSSPRDLDRDGMPVHSESGGSSEEDDSEPPRFSWHVQGAGLDEILWPPGMKAAATKVRVPRFDAVRPVGLEALKSEEEWRDYWVWLHWYSSWQVWYLNNDISHSKSRRKDRHGGDQKRASKATAYRNPSTVSR